MLSAEELQKILKLQPLPVEGGYFAVTYRSDITLARQSLPSGYSGERALATAIYYLLTPDSFSAMHRLRGDEVYHFYLGDPVKMLMLKPDGTGESLLIGQDVAEGMCLQHVVPGGVWQGSHLAAGGKFALLGTTMSPGFDPADFDMGKRDELSVRYPDHSALITLLTR
jgi:predicted cupin superfamily sugar epimerase